ncbi:hypothetical protein [Natrinema halophilum]|uniref:Uncharacterized protein n=1 Tax=Natrinema halophilum TaxID=1699371 RepID=A0A7D5KZ92_9EURY|nr:hypothetical protein [Natrinema halophilum]QLG48740.1 hypothetical protein HYG82_07710 [Natrinema halophilum]
MGRETAQDIRDEHVDRVVEYLIEEDAEIGGSEELVRDIEHMRRRTEQRFARGESVLSILLAGAAVFAPWWLAFILTVLLIVSMGTRLTAIEVVAFTDPDPETREERLFAMRVWNNKVLAESKVARNTVGAKAVRGLSRGVYDLYLDKVFIGSLRDQDVLNQSVLGQAKWTYHEIGWEAVEIIEEEYGIRRMRTERTGMKATRSKSRLCLESKPSSHVISSSDLLGLPDPLAGRRTNDTVKPLVDLPESLTRAL